MRLIIVYFIVTITSLKAQSYFEVYQDLSNTKNKVILKNDTAFIQIHKNGGLLSYQLYLGLFEVRGNRIKLSENFLGDYMSEKVKMKNGEQDVHLKVFGCDFCNFHLVDSKNKFIRGIKGDESCLLTLDSIALKDIEMGKAKVRVMGIGFDYFLTKLQRGFTVIVKPNISANGFYSLNRECIRLRKVKRGIELRMIEDNIRDRIIFQKVGNEVIKYPPLPQSKSLLPSFTW